MTEKGDPYENAMVERVNVYVVKMIWTPLSKN